MSKLSQSLPDGWYGKALGDICDIDPEMLSGATDPNYTFRYIDIASVGPNKISDDLSVEIFRSAPSRARKRVQKDDVLMATVRPNLKAFAKVSFDGVLVASTGFAVLRAVEGKSHPEFLKQILFSEEVEQQVESLVAGSNYPAITVGNIRRLHIIVPPYEEQQGIAEVLSALDEKIEAVEQEKAKLTQVLIGAFDDTFGQALQAGVTSAGLKSGALTDGWSRVAVLEAAPDILDFRGRTPLKIGMTWGGGDIPALSANNVEMGLVNFEKESYLGSDALYQKWMTQGECAKDDVLMTLEAPLGNIALVPDDRKYILSQRVILLKPNKNLMNGRYLSLYLRWKWFQQLLNEESTGTTATGIQRKKLEKLPVLVAPPDMVEGITCFLYSLLTQLDDFVAEIAKLRLQKQGLMRDLLTGKTRVQ